MAIEAIAGFTQSNYELGYAFKFVRMITLILIALFDVWGFAVGVVLSLALIASTKTVVGKGYLYPLIPFNAKDMKTLLHRRPISRDNT